MGGASWRRRVADLAAYAEKFGALIRCGVEVGEARGRNPGRAGVPGRDLGGADRGAPSLSRRPGRSSRPVFPRMVPEDGGVFHIGSPPAAYRNPAQLRRGGGARRRGRGLGAPQIAEELVEAGRQVYLSVEQ